MNGITGPESFVARYFYRLIGDALINVDGLQKRPLEHALHLENLCGSQFLTRRGSLLSLPQVFQRYCSLWHRLDRFLCPFWHRSIAGLFGPHNLNDYPHRIPNLDFASIGLLENVLTNETSCFLIFVEEADEARGVPVQLSGITHHLYPPGIFSESYPR